MGEPQRLFIDGPPTAQMRAAQIESLRMLDPSAVGRWQGAPYALALAAYESGYDDAILCRYDAEDSEPAEDEDERE